MKIHVNGDPVELPEGTTLAELLQRLGHAPGRSAAVEAVMCRAPLRQPRVLADGESVTLFQPIVGG